MRRLTSSHAEDLGGFVVEPGQEFDESDADSSIVERLEREGKLAKSESKRTAKSKSEGE